jgi:hypothetical protein
MRRPWPSVVAVRLLLVAAASLWLLPWPPTCGRRCGEERGGGNRGEKRVREMKWQQRENRKRGAVGLGALG